MSKDNKNLTNTNNDIYTNAQSLSSLHETKLTKQQQKHFKKLIEDYRKKTINSFYTRKNGQKYFADIRNSMGYSVEKKDLIYPIVAKKSMGSKIWDIDDNEYIDISMGYGVHFFGHNPSFVIDSIYKQLDSGMHLGPRTIYTTKTATLFSNITGLDRATFCCSGTHAVSTAIRLARTSTGKNKIIMFENSYHGHSVETLGLSEIVNGKINTIPRTIGVPQNVINDLLVLPYDNLESLSIISKNASECAAVLVEPVQSQVPGIQPKEFLHELRDLSLRKNIILIFDETVTGFRIQLGGAQEWFGIKADIAIYGKLIGGGMPIGVVAGDSKYLDHIDGGFWDDKQSPSPNIKTTFFAGTFNQNPLSISTTYTVLEKLRHEGNSLQNNLNLKTSKMVNTLNEYFIQKKCLLRVSNFGSLFRFSFLTNANFLYQPLEMDLFYYHIIKNGLYIWEGRSCYLSTAHTEEDISYIINVVKKSLEDLQADGFFIE